MKTIIAGSRWFGPNHYQSKKMDAQWVDDSQAKKIINMTMRALPWRDQITEVVSGGARGADRLGEWWAEQNGILITTFPAKWRDEEGLFIKSAGYKRNVEMAKYADACVCFWDGESRGTSHMIDIAKHYDLELYVELI